jgi:hypothetical protein
MDYLSLYYKNLAEQLQAKVNHLKQLMEAEVETKVKKATKTTKK